MVGAQPTGRARSVVRRPFATRTCFEPMTGLGDAPAAQPCSGGLGAGIGTSGADEPSRPDRPLRARFATASRRLPPALPNLRGRLRCPLRGGLPPALRHAGERTRTSKGFHPTGPKPAASASSATPARPKDNRGVWIDSDAGPRSSADRAADFESARGGSTPPGAIRRKSSHDTELAGYTVYSSREDSAENDARHRRCPHRCGARAPEAQRPLLLALKRPPVEKHLSIHAPPCPCTGRYQLAATSVSSNQR